MRVPSKNAPLVDIPDGQGGRFLNAGGGSPRLAGAGSFDAFNRGDWWRPIGKGLHDLNNALVGISLKVLEERAQTEALNAFVSLSDESNNYLYGDDGVFHREGVNAVGSTEGTSKFFQDRVTAFNSNLGSRRATEIFEAKATQLRMSVMGNVARHEGVQGQNALFEAQKATINANMNNTLINYADDQMWEDGLAQVLQEGQMMLASKGASPQHIMLTSMQTGSTMTAARIERMAMNAGSADDFNRAFLELQSVRLTEEDRMKSRAILEDSYYKLYAADLAANPSRPTRFTNSVIDFSGLPDQVKFTANKYAASYDISPHLAMAVIMAESGGNQAAVSPAGARGLMQLLPSTAKELGVDPDDPEDNIKGGIKYLKQQLDRFGGNEVLALMAYNAGPANAEAFMNTGKFRITEKNPTGKVFSETVNYIGKILGPNRLPPQLIHRYTSPGLVEKGNIDIDALPPFYRPDGSVVSIASMSSNVDGIEVLYPSIDENGNELTEEEAHAQYERTGRHLGKFADPKSASSYGAALSRSQGSRFGSLAPIAFEDALTPRMKLNLQILEHNNMLQYETKFKQDSALFLYDTIRGQINELPPAAREEQALAMINEIADSGVQKTVLSMYEQQKNIDTKMYNAANQSTSEAFKASIVERGLGPIDAMQELSMYAGRTWNDDNSVQRDMNADVVDSLNKYFLGQKNVETPENKAAAAYILRAIDSGIDGKPMTRPDLESLQYAMNLTDSQIKATNERFNGDGLRGKLPMGQVNDQLKILGRTDLQNDLDFYESVVEAYGPGAVPTPEKTFQIVKQLFTGGETRDRSIWTRGWGADTTLYEAQLNGREGIWLPFLHTDPAVHAQEVERLKPEVQAFIDSQDAAMFVGGKKPTKITDAMVREYVRVFVMNLGPLEKGGVFNRQPDTVQAGIDARRAREEARSSLPVNYFRPGLRSYSEVFSESLFKNTAGSTFGK